MFKGIKIILTQLGGEPPNRNAEAGKTNDLFPPVLQLLLVSCRLSPAHPPWLRPADWVQGGGHGDAVCRSQLPRAQGGEKDKSGLR